MIKNIVRSVVFYFFALWLVIQINPGFSIQGSFTAVAISGAVLSLLMLFIKPILSILFIPINIITFGLFSWVINVIVLYLLTLIIFEVKVDSWIFPGMTFFGFVIPEITINQIVNLIIISLAIVFIYNFLENISHK